MVREISFPKNFPENFPPEQLKPNPNDLLKDYKQHRKIDDAIAWLVKQRFNTL